MERNIQKESEKEEVGTPEGQRSQPETSGTKHLHSGETEPKTETVKMGEGG